MQKDKRVPDLSKGVMSKIKALLGAKTNLSQAAKQAVHDRIKPLLDAMTDLSHAAKLAVLDQMKNRIAKDIETLKPDMAQERQMLDMRESIHASLEDVIRRNK